MTSPHAFFVLVLCLCVCIVAHIFDMKHTLNFLTALLVEGAKLNPCVQFAMFNCQSGPGQTLLAISLVSTTCAAEKV